MNKKESFVDFIASVGKLGYFKYASGTVASFFAMLFYIAALLIFKIIYPVYFDYFWVVITILVMYISIPFSTKAEKLYNEKDSHKIVIDEVAGYFFTMLFLPHIINLGIIDIIKYAFFGFVLFRIFDVVKPYPISALQKIENGLGVVMDDILAGVYANICLHIIIRLLVIKL